jgi:hypothetical protein
MQELVKFLHNSLLEQLLPVLPYILQFVQNSFVAF